MNNASGLRKTIESVVNQNSELFEYFVIDGNSSDGSLDIIKENAEMITHWISEPDTGIYNAMNKGINFSNSEYCLFLNSGDWLNDDILNKIEWNQLNTDIIYFNMFRYYKPEKIEKQQYPTNLTLNTFINSNIGHQATLIKRDLLLKHGAYNETLNYHGDYDFWLKAIINSNCTTKYYPIYLSYYDMSGLTSGGHEQIRLEKENILKQYVAPRILEDYLNCNKKLKDLEILIWYRTNWTFAFLKIYYKVVKNVRKFFRNNN